MRRVVRGADVLQAMMDAGLFTADDLVRRVIIDLPVTGAAVMYVERYGDDRLLDLVTTMDGIEMIERTSAMAGRHAKGTGIPAQETRGGDRVNWSEAVPGEPLPELPPDAYPEPDSEELPLVLPGRDPEDEDEG